jgi:hypothetical protein
MTLDTNESLTHPLCRILESNDLENPTVATVATAVVIRIMESA